MFCGYLESLSVLEPVDLQAGVVEWHDPALHVSRLALGNHRGAGQRGHEDGLVKLLLILGDLPVRSPGPLQLGDLPHALRVLGVKDKGALGKDLARGSGDGLSEGVGGPAFVDALVGGPQTGDVE